MLDQEFETGSSGASETRPIQASKLRKGGFVVMVKANQQRACKIVEMSTSKTGKHGHAKIHMVAIDIFDGTKIEDICPSTHNMLEPIITRPLYQVVGIDEDDKDVDLMKDDGDTFSIKCTDDDVFDDIKRYFEEDGGCMVTLVTALGNQKLDNPKKMT